MNLRVPSTSTVHSQTLAKSGFHTSSLVVCTTRSFVKWCTPTSSISPSMKLYHAGRKSGFLVAMQINGSTVETRYNLWQALIYLRLSNTPWVLWIDALCINQEEFMEINQQASQIGQIYENKFSVMDWPGLPDATNEIGMIFFRLVSLSKLHNA
jgi:Heterokaryon incompatibility protein (HET)